MLFRSEARLALAAPWGLQVAWVSIAAAVAAAVGFDADDFAAAVDFDADDLAAVVGLGVRELAVLHCIVAAETSAGMKMVIGELEKYVHEELLLPPASIAGAAVQREKTRAGVYL